MRKAEKQLKMMGKPDIHVRVSIVDHSDESATSEART